MAGQYGGHLKGPYLCGSACHPGGNTTGLQVIIVHGVSNSWSDGSADTVFKISQQGKYWIDVLSGSCKTSDTINVALQFLPVIKLGNDTSLCDNALLLLEAKKFRVILPVAG